MKRLKHHEHAAQASVHCSLTHFEHAAQASVHYSLTHFEHAAQASAHYSRLLSAILSVVALVSSGSSLQAAARSASSESPCLLVPAVQKLRLVAARTQSMNNLKQIALAMHSHHDVYKMFPPAGDMKGLSWRVYILPFIEQQPLFNEFRMDQPWDSEHNKKLIARMPNVYAVPAAPTVPGQTFYRGFVGGGAFFDQDNGTRIAQITDGTSNTIMCFESSQSVIWTKPEEIAYDAKKPLPKWADFYGTKTFLAAFCDGSVHTLRHGLTEPTLRALITRDGGEPVGPDFFD